ncbi:MAG: hypothetical protein IID36_08565 [Planctomycetes bacterium]|nr:hypothetical protein [Planctomycetota bacterium]
MAKQSLVKEFVLFIRHEKKWWLIPLIIVLLLVCLLWWVAVATPAGMFVYPFV